MHNQQPNPVGRHGRFRELTATTLWQGKGKFQPMGNSHSVTAQVTVPKINKGQNISCPIVCFALAKG